MRSILLNSITYQEINFLCVWVMAACIIYAKVFTKSIKQNMSRFLILLMLLYSGSFICDAFRDYCDRAGGFDYNVVSQVSLVYYFCTLFAAVLWFLYVLTTLFPTTKRNYYIYVIAVLPAACLVTHSIAHVILGQVTIAEDGVVLIDSKLFAIQKISVVIYYFGSLIIGHVHFFKKKQKLNVHVMCMCAYSLPILIFSYFQYKTNVNYQIIGITTSYTIYIFSLMFFQDKAQRKELVHFANIMDSLKNQYTSIFYSNLITNQIEAYVLTKKAKKKSDELDREYDEFMKIYADNMVYTSDRDMFLENVNRDHVRRELEKNSKKTFEYRLADNGEIINMQVDFWRAKEDVEIHHAVIGFKDISAEKKLEKDKATNDTIIHGLMNGFEYVCYFDYGNADFKEYHASKNFEYFFNIVGAKDGFDRFVSLFKHGMSSEEYEEFRIRFDQNTILEEILDNGTFSMDCCLNLGNGLKYFNIKAIGNSKNPEVALFAITDIDEQVRRELEKEERAKEKEYSIQLEQTIAERTAELHEKAKTLNQINEEITELLGNITEARDMESGEHIKRVKGFTRILANHIKEEWPEYGLDDEQIALITSASALHDIGKIMISDNILRKPGRFTPEEFDIMKSHTSKGCEMLEMAPKGWDKRYLDFSMEICKYHHEKWDGKGYPEGLTGDDIPISAQIVSVADCFDALTTKRIYKDAYDPEVAFDMILSGQCGSFSDKMMASFRNAKEEFFSHMHDITDIGNNIPVITASSALSDVNILLIEDNELTSEITTEILTEEGAKVTTLASGKQVIDYLAEAGKIEFDAILMDLELPDIDGFELTRTIRSMEIGRARVAPIIAVSSSSDRLEMQRAINAGMNSFIPKPVSVANITKTLLACMRSEQKYLKTKLDEAIMRANKDPLTGVKNMTAYTETVGEITRKIANKEELEFAIVMCDVNKLKVVNDTYGHDMGDKFIKNCCNLICSTYSHSPVYRIGGDEFAVILTGMDYTNRDELIDSLGEKLAKASKIDRIEDGRAVMAVGMSVYKPYSDVSVASVTKRADESMYNNKRIMEFGSNY